MLPSDRSIDRGAVEIDGSERGSAALEFILVGLLMLVPLVYLIGALGALQGQSLGAEVGARHIARAIATADDTHDAGRRAERVLAAVADEYGLDREMLALSISCRPAAGGCPAAGATLVVTLRTDVPLPLVPPVLGLERVALLPVEATAVQKMSRAWGSG